MAEARPAETELPYHSRRRIEARECGRKRGRKVTSPGSTSLTNYAPGSPPLRRWIWSRMRGFPRIPSSRDGQVELLFEAFDGTDGAFGLDLPAPAEQETEFEAFHLLVRLLVVAEELPDAFDPVVDRREGRGVVAPVEGDMPERPGVHHRDVGPILVELQLVAGGSRARTTNANMRICLVSRTTRSWKALEMERGKVAVIVLDALAHEARTAVRVELEGLARRLGDAGGLLERVEQALAPGGPSAIGAARPAPSGSGPGRSASGSCRDCRPPRRSSLAGRPARAPSRPGST